MIWTQANKRFGSQQERERYSRMSLKEKRKYNEQRRKKKP